MNSLHNPEIISFASDNYAGAHPEILAALTAANGGHVAAYGYDPYTERLQQVMRHHFGDQAECWPVFNGTGANVLGLQAMLPRWGAVICANSAHLNTDENGAPQITGGLKLWLVDTPDGKLTPDLIAEQAWGFGSEHRAQPLVVSISQTTEYGTCYSVDEIRAIADYAHSLGMKLHMDGARIANAAAYLNLPLRSMTTDAGVDLLSFGGTKNGLLFGECLVALSADAVTGMAHLRKINLQLASKMRFISAQFIALLENDLWLHSACHSNRMALRLKEGLEGIDGVSVCYPVQSNAVFACLPPHILEQARRHFAFYDWDNHGMVRLMCSFDTRAEDVDKLTGIMRNAIL
ncbi:low specificity L-threonine aldolase [Uruburuella testudinis]|uniref:Low specificity L-threonine aldolase n=1 Tax=Uruburuella testudinis TaxID=1282863 RepID=A0ABY4DSF5_9NEIS|nr:low specificity L-threonine aldolase [Uruburuella testudinis]UOO81964.1 low specificity L-threonine aldolase [Uruburuella testudinis]